MKAPEEGAHHQMGINDWSDVWVMPSLTRFSVTDVVAADSIGSPHLCKPPWLQGLVKMTTKCSRYFKSVCIVMNKTDIIKPYLINSVSNWIV
jgi:hypothetical protein